MAWGRINKGGGGGAFAMILANYPAGSTITCTNTNGKRAISATQMLFFVKKPSSGTTQSCVVTITDGTHTKSETVSITYEGQSVNITMAYELVLFGDGVDNTAITGGWIINTIGSPALTISDGLLIAKNGTGDWSYGYTGSFGTVNNIDLTNYSTLKYRCVYRSAVSASVNIFSPSTWTSAASANVPSATAEGTEYSIPLNSGGTAITSGRVGGTLEKPEGTGIAWLKFSKIWLE